MSFIIDTCFVKSHRVHCRWMVGGDRGHSDWLLFVIMIDGFHDRGLPYIYMDYSTVTEVTDPTDSHLQQDTDNIVQWSDENFNYCPIVCHFCMALILIKLPSTNVLEYICLLTLNGAHMLTKLKLKYSKGFIFSHTWRRQVLRKINCLTAIGVSSDL